MEEDDEDEDEDEDDELEELDEEELVFSSVSKSLLWDICFAFQYDSEVRCHQLMLFDLAGWPPIFGYAAGTVGPIEASAWRQSSTSSNDTTAAASSRT